MELSQELGDWLFLLAQEPLLRWAISVLVYRVRFISRLLKISLRGSMRRRASNAIDARRFVNRTFEFVHRKSALATADLSDRVVVH